MTINKAIKEAIKGGYDYNRKYAGGSAAKALMLIDPEFWKGFCRAIVLDDEYCNDKIKMCIGCGVALKWNEKPTMDGKHGGKNGCGSDIVEYDGHWLIEMHRFIDHLAEGKTQESFFEPF